MKQSISTIFAQSAERQGSALAVADEYERLTYAQLANRANQLSHAIIAATGSRSQPALLLFEQGVNAITAILGALGAGKFYVPLDPAYPEAHLRTIIEDVNAEEATPPLVITGSAHTGLVAELLPRPYTLINIDQLPNHCSVTAPQVDVDPASLAYLMYTSGSTGTPKGVMVSHNAVLQEVRRTTTAFQIVASDRQTLLRSHSFNGAVRDIFATLLNGASLHSFNLQRANFDALHSWLDCEQITTWRSVTPVLRAFMNTLAPHERINTVRLVHTGGEAVSRRDVSLFQRHFRDDAVLVSGLGLTETGSVRHFFITSDTRLDDSAVPVGYPVEGADVLLLDADKQPVPLGAKGEIVIRARHMADGYWRKPTLTAQRFKSVNDVSGDRLYFTGDLGRMGADGCLFHLGRKDFQVKIRGIRVEPAEVEAVLKTVDGVRDAAVVAQLRPSAGLPSRSTTATDGSEENLNENASSEHQLVGYVVPLAQSVTRSAIRIALEAQLPAHMVPAAFVLLDALPINHNGKVDRRALPAPQSADFASDVDHTEPGNPVQSLLVTIFQEVLGIERIGTRDDFFRLGGHSLHATQLASRLAEYDISLPLQTIFDAPTVEQLSERVEALLLQEEAF